VTGSVIGGQTTRVRPVAGGGQCCVRVPGSGAFDIGLGHRGDPGPVRLIDRLGQLMR